MTDPPHLPEPMPAAPPALERIATALESIAAQLAVIAVNTNTTLDAARVNHSGPVGYRTVSTPRDNQG